MEGQHGWSLPAACPVTAVAPDLSGSLSYGVPDGPTSADTSLPPSFDGIVPPQEAVLLRAASILHGAQVQYLYVCYTRYLFADFGDR